MPTSLAVLLALLLTSVCLAGETNMNPFANPIVRQDWPDPGVLFVEDATSGEGAYYLVATGGIFPIRRSTNLVDWEETGAAVMPQGKAPWAPDGHRNWAPELHRVNGRYIAYYTSSDHRRDALRNDSLAVGAAWADDILGPYNHLEEPLVPAGPYGVIDATYFREGERQWLYWKTDGNCCGQATDILAQELAPDGLSFMEGSAPQLILSADLEWELNLIEGPEVIRRGEWIYLFYSAGSYVTNYRNGVARARSPLGPFEKLAEPWLMGSEEVRAPGHGTILDVEGQTIYIHHGRSPGVRNARYLFLTPIAWREDWPWVEGTVVPASGSVPWRAKPRNAP
jgi:beta-xylosidase